jgi:hypothetical protein
MIPAAQLEKLKKLFAEDGTTLTDAEALEIGLWLVARVKPVLVPVPLDKMAFFGTIKRETNALRLRTRFVNLFAWRCKPCKKQKHSPTNRCIRSTPPISKSPSIGANPAKTKTGR